MYPVAVQRNPLAGVDANLLVALDALLTEESVAGAAEKLGLSASAMSHALGRLRQLLDDPVLVRSGQHMTATTRARAIAAPLRQGMELVARAVLPPAPFDLRAEQRTLRIGAIDFAQNHLLPPLVRLLQREAPGVDVTVAAPEPRSFKDLAANELDLVLAMPRAETPFRCRALREEPFCTVLREGHLALRRPLTPAAFAALSHVLISSPARRVGTVDRALAALGLSRRVALMLPSFTAAAIVVSQSDLVLTGARLEAERVREALRLVVLPPPVAIPPFSLAMFWHERHEHEPFLAWVRERIVELAADARPAR